jgi:hypothetical protein
MNRVGFEFPLSLLQRHKTVLALKRAVRVMAINLYLPKNIKEDQEFVRKIGRAWTRSKAITKTDKDNFRTQLNIY